MYKSNSLSMDECKPFSYKTIVKNLINYLQNLSTTKHLHDKSRRAGLIRHITIHQKSSELTILNICYWNTQARHGAHEEASKDVHQLAECRKSKLKQI
ncbi:GSCOCG00007747001-RA-CDS [Cotesia congregata]|nr:GSCOCG00007747001-RA-CDS [Cotesia congregata]